MKVLFSINQYEGEDYILVLEYIAQQVSFLSFTEYLASLRVPQGRELQFREFSNRFARHPHGQQTQGSAAAVRGIQGRAYGCAGRESLAEPRRVPAAVGTALRFHRGTPS